MSNSKERRRYPRIARIERAIVQIVSSSDDALSPGTIVKCSSQDVSMQGLKIRTEHAVDEGCRLELWVEISGHRGKFYLAGEVKWCREREGADGYFVGIELTDRGQATELASWRKLVSEINLVNTEDTGKVVQLVPRHVERDKRRRP